MGFDAPSTLPSRDEIPSGFRREKSLLPPLPVRSNATGFHFAKRRGGRPRGYRRDKGVGRHARPAALRYAERSARQSPRVPQTTRRRPPKDLQATKRRTARGNAANAAGARHITSMTASPAPALTPMTLGLQRSLSVAVCSRSPATASRIRHRKYLRFW